MFEARLMQINAPSPIPVSRLFAATRVSARDADFVHPNLGRHGSWRPFSVDRANAIRLLKALVAAGANSDTLMVNALVHDIALRDASLRGTELSSALAYAEGQGWIADGPREGAHRLSCSLGSLRASVGVPRRAHQRRLEQRSGGQRAGQRQSQQFAHAGNPRIAGEH
jgi:hypothetical protein